MEFQSRITQYSFDEMMIDDDTASLDSYMGKHPCNLSATFNEALDSPSPPSTEEISDTETEAATEIVEETEGRKVLPSRLEVTFTTPLDGFDPLQRRLSRLTHRLRHSVLYFLSLYGISIQYALYPIEESGIRGVHDALPVVLLVATEYIPVSMWRKGVKRAYEYLVDIGGFPAIEIPVSGQEARSEDGVDMRMSRECKVYLAKLVAREF
jgi:3-phytase